MKKNKGFLALVLFCVLLGCSSVELDPETDDATDTTLTLSLNEGYDFGLNQTVSNEDDADIYLKLYDNVPTLFFNEWATVINRPFEDVATVNLFVTPKLTAVLSSFLAFNLPNLTMVSKTQDGNYVKYHITDTDGIVPTELGFSFLEDEFTYTIDYVINREGIPEF
jgi:hypothetical protein